MTDDVMIKKVSALMDAIYAAIPDGEEPVLVLAALEGVFMQRHAAYQAALNTMTDAATATATDVIQ